MMLSASFLFCQFSDLPVSLRSISNSQEPERSVTFCAVHRQAAVMQSARERIFFMGVYGSLWGFMGVYGSLWELWELWELMGIYGLNGPNGVNGWTWCKVMKIRGQCVSTTVRLCG